MFVSSFSPQDDSGSIQLDSPGNAVNTGFQQQCAAHSGRIEWLFRERVYGRLNTRCVIACWRGIECGTDGNIWNGNTATAITRSGEIGDAVAKVISSID